MRNAITHAVIYCRVSSKKQELEGNGLASQEQRCRAHAASRGYQVLEVFTERGLTGAALDRPAMQEMLRFLKEKHGEYRGVAVIIDDLKRFAREVEVHFALKMALSKRGARLDSPSFQFEDTPENKFVETMLAATAELERNQNKSQVVNRQRSRLEAGHWAFRPLVGYRKSGRGASSSMAPAEATAPLVAKALDGFASGRFATAMDVRQFLIERGHFKGRSVTVELTRVRSLLKRAWIYAGYVEHKPWGVTLRKGHHIALITADAARRIEAKLGGEGRSPPAKRTARPEFPLKGYVSCAACGRALTGSLCAGRSKRYPYYHCPNHLCDEYGKAIRPPDMETRFAELLDGRCARPEVIRLARKILLDVWEEELGSVVDVAASRAKREKEIEVAISDIVGKMMAVTNATVIKKLEDEVERLERDRLLLSEPGQAKPSLPDVGTAFDRLAPILENPYQTWKRGDAERKRLVTTMVFATRLPYGRNCGFGTVEYTLPYQQFGDPNMTCSSLVDMNRSFWNDLTCWLLKWADRMDSSWTPVNVPGKGPF